ncbi:MAG: dephospho-CoA kinase [Eisenbergiella sp.]
MKTIGITGGIGAGKSRILSYIQQNCNCRILLSDEAAHEIQEPGMNVTTG